MTYNYVIFFFKEIEFGLTRVEYNGVMDNPLDVSKKCFGGTILSILDISLQFSHIHWVLDILIVILSILWADWFQECISLL